VIDYVDATFRTHWMCDILCYCADTHGGKKKIKKERKKERKGCDILFYCAGTQTCTRDGEIHINVLRGETHKNVL